MTGTLHFEQSFCTPQPVEVTGMVMENRVSLRANNSTLNLGGKIAEDSFEGNWLSLFGACQNLTGRFEVRRTP